MGLPQNKISLIHLAKSRLGITDDDYRAILSRCAGVTSSTELDQDGFAAVMDEFHRIGFQSEKRRKASFGAAPLGRAGMASPEQVIKIQALWSEVTDGGGTDAQLDRWIERQFKVSALRFVRADLVPKIIGALEGWKRRKHASA